MEIKDNPIEPCLPGEIVGIVDNDRRKLKTSSTLITGFNNDDKGKTS